MAVANLKPHPLAFLDARPRWSLRGGEMWLLCQQQPQISKLAIAASPVTAWRSHFSAAPGRYVFTSHGCSAIPGQTDLIQKRGLFRFVSILQVHTVHTLGLGEPRLHIGLLLELCTVVVLGS